MNLDLEGKSVIVTGGGSNIGRAISLAFAKEGAEIGKFTRKRDVYVETMMRTVSFWAARVPLAQFIFGLALPLVLWQGGREVIRSEILLGDLVKVIFYILAIGNRMGSIGQFTNIIQTAGASAERILEIVQEPERIKSGHRKLPPRGGSVSRMSLRTPARATSAARRSTRSRSRVW